MSVYPNVRQSPRPWWMRFVLPFIRPIVLAPDMSARLFRGRWYVDVR